MQANTHDSLTCIVVDPNYDWDEWATPPIHSLVIYECHIGSFTGYHDPEVVGIHHHVSHWNLRRTTVEHFAGTFAAMEERLDHIASCGFTAIQLMPVLEYSGSWGYNPRLLFPVHGVSNPHMHPAGSCSSLNMFCHDLRFRAMFWASLLGADAGAAI
eukprot:scaffold592069_cov53-Prasinocladus_malaysianus.AAC.1